MASVYGSSGKSTLDTSRVDAYLPILEVERGFRLERLQKAAHIDAVHALLNIELEAGNSWPFYDRMNRQEFLAYYCHGSCPMVLVQIDDDSVVGTFYVKANFPDRASSICNGGFIVHPKYRGQGVGKLLAGYFLRIAPDLGFTGSLFNLVFECNTASIRLWESMGFQRVGSLPHCARLKGHDELITAHMYYKNLID